MNTRRNSDELFEEYKEFEEYEEHDDRPAQQDEPLVDIATIGVNYFLDHEPPARHYIIENILPLGIVGLLAAGGGTGKSFLLLQLSLSIVTGRPFLGIQVSDPGAVLLFCAEDERDELHRRLFRVVQAMRDADEFGDIDVELMRERLFIASRVGSDNLITNVIDGVAMRTNIGKRIALTAEQIPNLKLIGLDPVSRFRGGDENNNDHATRFIEAVESLRAETGATVLMPHHMSKDGLRAGVDRIVPENLRGASALLDAVRWAAAMATLRKDAAHEYGIDPEEASRYVRFDIVKNNYAPPWDGLWLERQRGGVLVPTDMPTTRQRNQEQRSGNRYRDTLPRLKGLIRQRREQGKITTRRRLRDYAGKDGIFGIGDHALRAIIERAIAEGDVYEKSVGKVTELHL